MIPVDLSVRGEGCEITSKTQDSKTFPLQLAGNYDVDAYAIRGESGKCNTQTNESFTARIGGNTGPIAEDDADECTISSRNQYVGTFELVAGDNTVAIKTSSQCPPDNSPNSVKVSHLCLNRLPDQYEIPTVMAPFNIDGHKNEFKDSHALQFGNNELGYEGSLRFVSEQDALHVLAEVKDPHLNSIAEKRDEDILQDDSIAIMLDMDKSKGTGPKENDFRFFVNLKNAKADSNGEDFYWNSDFESVVRYVGTLNNNSDIDMGYTIEMKIPWSSLGLTGEPDKDVVFGFETVLNDVDGAGSRLIYPWSNANGQGIHDPNGWGELVFLGKSLSTRPLLTFHQSATAVKPVGEVELSWETVNATRCYALGDWQGQKEISGKETITDINTAKLFKLVCANDDEAVVKSVNVIVSEIAPQTSLDLDTTTVSEGELVELSWNSQNASSCTASGDWYGEKLTVGKEKIRNITSDKIFTLTCSGYSGTVTKTVHVSVSSSAPKLIFTSSATAVQVGGPVELNWTSQNTTACTASGDWTGTKNLAGKEIISNVQKNSTFALTCSGETGSITKKANVVLSTTAPSLSFHPSSTSVVRGGSIDLDWESVDSTECMATGDWSGARPPAGTEKIFDIQTAKQFTLTCSGTITWDGTVPTVETVSKTVNISLASSPPTLTLSSDKTATTVGGSVKLTWTSANTNTCVASGSWTGSKAKSGQEIISAINEDKSFTLTCSGNSGQVSKTVNVTLIDGPIDPPADAPAPPITACHQITTADPTKVPSRFAFPWDIFSTAQEIFIKVMCKVDSIEAEVGTGNDNFFVWHQGYITKDGTTWETIELTSEQATGNGNWLFGKGKVVTPIATAKLMEPNYLATYTCAFVENSWKCGCREKASCNDAGKWNFQSFQFAPAIPNGFPLTQQ